MRFAFNRTYKKVIHKNNILLWIRVGLVWGLCGVACSWCKAQTRVASNPTPKPSQDTVKLVTVVLERANEVTGGEFIDSTVSPPLLEEFRAATGNVLFRESTTTVECDTAVQFLTTRKIRVVGNVKIVRDTVTITGYEGFYFPDARRSELKKDVTLSDTKVLLKSDSGIYLGNQRCAIFSGSVSLKDSASMVFCDSLVYFRDNARSQAFRNVRLINFADNAIITGGYAEHFNNSGYSFIIQQPLLTKIDSTQNGKVDTLLIRAVRMDSYRGQQDSVPRIEMQDSVRIRWGTDLYAKAKNATYRLKDQKILLYGQPIVWFERSQLTGDSMVVQLKEREKKLRIEKVYIYRNAFLVSKDSLDKTGLKFNQVSGIDMVITFDDSARIQQADVYKQARSLYYTYDGTKPRGANASSGDEINIYFRNNRVRRIRVRGDVEGEQYPERLLFRKDSNLPGFQWRETEKPVL
jgi:lipopolysaccharide export system protein LptA